MSNEKLHVAEIPVNPDLAYEYMMLLRGGKPHDLDTGYRKRRLNEREIERASELIQEIVDSTPGVNIQSLQKMMFDSPLVRINPKTDLHYNLPFDFGMLSRESFSESSNRYSFGFENVQVMRNHYLVGDAELAILRAGDAEVEKRHPIPKYDPPLSKFR